VHFTRSGLIVGLILSVYFSQSASAFRGGPPAGRTGGPANGGATCRACHGNTIGTGSVEILGAPDNYQANAVYDLTVRVSDSVKVGAGFQISVEDSSGNHIGALSLIDPVNTELNAEFYVNHTFDGVDTSVAGWAANGNSASFPVRWTAPSTDMGSVTFWAAGNAINNNFSSSGDFIYLTSKTAGFASVPAVSTWGMIVLTLALMTGGTILTMRRQPAFALVRAD
jgi:hypothetical protein